MVAASHDGLLAAAQAGNVAALNRLLTAHRHGVYRVRSQGVSHHGGRRGRSAGDALGGDESDTGLSRYGRVDGQLAVHHRAPGVPAAVRGKSTTSLRVRSRGGRLGCQQTGSRADDNAAAAHRVACGGAVGSRSASPRGHSASRYPGAQRSGCRSSVGNFGRRAQESPSPRAHAPARSHFAQDRRVLKSIRTRACRG